MAEYTRQEVMEAAHKLADMLANTEEINRFKKVEAKINQNTKVKKNIENIKILQKQAVNLQAYEKTEALKKVNEQIDRLQAEIDDIPVVQEFKEIQIVVNDVLQLVSGTIAREVKNDVIRATGGDVLSGKTGTKVEE
ncbi:MAG TPA: YlbF family regulator [Bacillota bacterium]|nr:YlbF family regulator [Bacillota bacterium]